MRKINVLATGTLAAFLFLVSSGSGQEPDFEPVEVDCQADETPDSCFLRNFQDAPLESSADAAGASQKARAQEAVQDLLGNLINLGNAGTTADFLQAFILGLDFPGFQEEAGRLSFTYNTPPGPSILASFSAVENEPELFSKLKEAIPESDRATKTEDLGERLGRFDDLKYSLKLVFLGKDGRFSRNLADFDDRLGSRLLGHYAANRDRSESEAVEEILALGDAQKNFSELSPGEKRRIEAIIAKAVNATRKSDAELDSFVENAGFYRAADLAANQPQLYIAAEYHDLEELAGPSNWMAKLVWELGLGPNINSVLAQCGAKGDEEFLTCFTAYANNARVERQLASRHRLRFEAGYGETDRYGPKDYSSFIPGVNLEIARVESLAARLDYGLVLRFQYDADGKKIEQNTFAIEAKYEDVSGDEQREDRFVATATLTQRVTDDMSLELSAVWANKAGYRGEVDEELGAKAGIRYKINRPQP